jgi:hypothetical protein
MDLPVAQSDGSVLLSFGDSDGGVLTWVDLPKFEVWASTNLKDWQVLGGALVLTNGSVFLRDDAAATFPQRFYRVVEKP